MAELKKCPFCGGEAEKWSCDRLITISCKKCNYTRSFAGLVSNKKTDVPVVYEGGIFSDTEFYNRYAHEEAEEAWNNRATEAEIRAKAIDEFAEKLGRLCENSAMALDRYNGRPLYNKDGKWHDLINDVAEQLKGE